MEDDCFISQFTQNLLLFTIHALQASGGTDCIYGVGQGGGGGVGQEKSLKYVNIQKIYTEVDFLFFLQIGIDNFFIFLPVLSSFHEKYVGHENFFCGGRSLTWDDFIILINSKFYTKLLKKLDER